MTSEPHSETKPVLPTRTLSIHLLFPGSGSYGRHLGDLRKLKGHLPPGLSIRKRRNGAKVAGKPKQIGSLLLVLDTDRFHPTGFSL